MHMMSELVGEHCFNLIVRVILQQRVSENDSARISQSCERRVRFLAFFRQLPFINPTHAGSRALTQLH